MKTEVLVIGGMSCSGCASNVERALQHCDGVSRVGVNFGTSKASVTYDESRTNRARLEVAVKTAGYDVVGPAFDQKPPAWWRNQLLHTVAIGALLAVGWLLGY